MKHLLEKSVQVAMDKGLKSLGDCPETLEFVSGVNRACHGDPKTVREGLVGADVASVVATHILLTARANFIDNKFPGKSPEVKKELLREDLMDIMIKAIESGMIMMEAINNKDSSFLKSTTKRIPKE